MGCNSIVGINAISRPYKSSDVGYVDGSTTLCLIVRLFDSGENTHFSEAQALTV
jgi:hypothetical protein